jgi:hypothetical protein
MTNMKKRAVIASLLSFFLVFTLTLTGQTGELITEKADKPSGHQIIKDKFIEGDPVWMTPVLICFLVGLTIVFIWH